MNSTQDPDFSRIAQYLLKNRDSILANWRSAVAGDPKVSAAASLARTQFLDHIPRILDAFDHALRARDRIDEKIAEAEQRAGAADHGENRWLHGYNSRETMREWGHLHICMLQELEAFALGGALVDPSAVSVARTMLAQLFVDCMVESAASHATLERAEAESRLAELERVLQELRSVDRARIELWREAAHDLRGTVGAVKLAATALGHVVSAPELPGMVNLVRRGADSLDILLSDLIELTRLEAGREHRDVADFSVVELIRDLADSLQPLAAQRGLFLKVQTPAALLAQGDAVKVRRIAQNLVLNALKYTDQGGVVVSCTESTSGDVRRWALCIQDTGVGIDGASETPLAHAISEATQEAHMIAQEAVEREPDLPPVPPNAPTLRSESPDSSRAGEGIGLSIVKRLCELLDASIELESHRGRGTTFRITFPAQYPA
jgi:signal transduction histidine kinase